MLHHAHNFGRDLKEQLDRQNYIRQRSFYSTCTNDRNLKAQTRSFQDKGDVWEYKPKDQGRGKGRRDKKD